MFSMLNILFIIISFSKLFESGCILSKFLKNNFLDLKKLPIFIKINENNFLLKFSPIIIEIRKKNKLLLIEENKIIFFS